MSKSSRPSLPTLRHLLLIAICLLWAAAAIEARGWKASDYKTTTQKSYKKSKLLQRKIDFKNVDYPALHAALFYETNARRLKHGLSALAHHPLLEKTAFRHSRDTVRQDFFAHVNPNTNSTPQIRGKQAGIAKPSLAENIATHFGLRYEQGKGVYTPAKGQFSYTPDGPLLPPHTYLSLAKSLLDQWMHSPGHRKNILSKKAVQLGCGAYVFFNDKFNDMPMFKATQNFQWFKKIP